MEWSPEAPGVERGGLDARPCFHSVGGDDIVLYVVATAPTLTEASVEQIAAVSGHITAMQCYSQTAPKGSSETFTLRLNRANTADICTIAAGSTNDSVTALDLSVAAGNLLDLKVSGPKTCPRRQLRWRLARKSLGGAGRFTPQPGETPVSTSEVCKQIRKSPCHH